MISILYLIVTVATAWTKNQSVEFALIMSLSTTPSVPSANSFETIKLSVRIDVVEFNLAHASTEGATESATESATEGEKEVEEFYRNLGDVATANFLLERAVRKKMAATI